LLNCCFNEQKPFTALAVSGCSVGQCIPHYCIQTRWLSQPTPTPTPTPPTGADKKANNFPPRVELRRHNLQRPQCTQLLVGEIVVSIFCTRIMISNKPLRQDVSIRIIRTTYYVVSTTRRNIVYQLLAKEYVNTKTAHPSIHPSYLRISKETKSLCVFRSGRRRRRHVHSFMSNCWNNQPGLSPYILLYGNWLASVLCYMLAGRCRRRRRHRH
jgi:hypothetical protein